jgi:cell division protein FtsW (lipid II flippase)
MIALLAVNMMWSLFMLHLSHHQATQNAMNFYPETLPTMYQAGAAAGFALLGLLIPVRQIRYCLLVVSSITIGFLFIPAIYALNHWPGGDDGGGFGWIFLIGGGCLISIILAISTCCVGAWLLRKTGKNEPPDLKPASDQQG